MKRKCHHPLKCCFVAGEELHCRCGKVIVGKRLPAKVFKNMAALFQSGYRGAFSLRTGKPI